MADMNLLNETFELYYRKAKESYAKGDKFLAKRYYMLAAEQMLKMAKDSKGELQKARFGRAKSLIEMADTIAIEKQAVSNDKPDDGVSVQSNEKVTLAEALNNLNSWRVCNA